MANYNSTHTGPQIDEAVAAALPNGRLDLAIQAAINTAVSRAVAQLAAKIHAEQHKAGGPDPITPADIGAFATDGSSTLTGNFIMSKGGSPQFKMTNTSTGRSVYLLNSESTKSLQFINQLDSNNNNMLRINPETDSIKSALTLVNKVGGVLNSYNILHEGNIADFAGTTRFLAGTYDGTGDNGSKYPCTIECGWAPKGAIIFNLTDDAQGDDLFAFFVHGQKGMQFGSTYMANEYGYTLNVMQMDGTTWGETALSWYRNAVSGSTSNGEFQMNDYDNSYGFFIWG